MRFFQSSPLFNPVMTFPPAVKEMLLDAYREAEVILEYGSGGSTFMAAELRRKVIAVESDALWAQKMNRILTGYDARVVHVDIGKTGRWGKPFKPDGWENYYRYPMEVWDTPDFTHPDVVLVDGRFRVACFCATLLRIEGPVKLFFDDYVAREDYHLVERLVKPLKIVERMAVFDLAPMEIPKSEWTWIMGAFFKTTYTKR